MYVLHMHVCIDLLCSCILSSVFLEIKVKWDMVSLGVVFVYEHISQCSYLMMCCWSRLIWWVELWVRHRRLEAPWGWYRDVKESLTQPSPTPSYRIWTTLHRHRLGKSCRVLFRYDSLTCSDLTLLVWLLEEHSAAKQSNTSNPQRFFERPTEHLVCAP